MSIEIGDLAPDFSLKSQHGELITLSDFRPKPVFLIFLPFAASGICTGELCEIRDRIEEIEGAEIVAVTCDHFFSNRAWAEREGYNFSILSDFWPHGQTASAYSIFDEAIGAALRATFLLDSAGIVRWKVEHGVGEARNFADYRQALLNLQ